jgi:hypothetical protein
MTPDELEALLKLHPTLYHMTACGGWASIQKHGLLSTAALVSRSTLPGEEHDTVLSTRRPSNIPLEGEGGLRAVIRDQRPIDEQKLTACLLDGLAPQDWHRLLNKKVFFWLDRSRVDGLLGAAAYRSAAHDIIEVDARRLLADYRNHIWLCPINSGSTLFNPQPRGRTTFARIEDYPFRHWATRRGSRRKAVTELAVDHAIRNVNLYVRRVTRCKACEPAEVIFSN